MPSRHIKKQKIDDDHESMSISTNPPFLTAFWSDVCLSIAVAIRPFLIRFASHADLRLNRNCVIISLALFRQSDKYWDMWNTVHNNNNNNNKNKYLHGIVIYIESGQFENGNCATEHARARSRSLRTHKKKWSHNSNRVNRKFNAEILLSHSIQSTSPRIPVHVIYQFYLSISG